MTPSEVAWLKNEIDRKQYTRETRDCRDYVIDEVCDADDCGAEEGNVYSERLSKSIRALIAENEAKDAEIERLREAAENMLERILAVWPTLASTAPSLRCAKPLPERKRND